MSNLTPPPLFSGGKKVPTGETPVVPASNLPPLPKGDFMPNQFHNRDGVKETPPKPHFEVLPALSKTVGDNVDVSEAPAGVVEQTILDEVEKEQQPLSGKPSRKELKEERSAEFDSFLQPVDPKKGGKVKPGKKVKEPKAKSDIVEDKKKTSGLTWVLLAVLVIAGAGAGYYFFLM